MIAVTLFFLLTVAPPPATTALRRACECVQKRAQTPVDPWIAEDKTKHAATSFALTTFGYASARTLGISHDTSAPLAAMGGFALGIAKEINDKRTGRDFSLRDLVADAAGVALASLLATHTR